MSEKRYSLKVAGKFVGVSACTIRYRAEKLGIVTEGGLTAANVKAIAEYLPLKTKYARRDSYDDLVAEMRELNGR